MAKFIYNMENILNIKSKIEDQKKNEYRKSIKELKDFIEEKNNLIAKNKEIMKEFKDSINNNVSRDKVEYYNKYIVYIKNAIAKQEKKIEHAREIVEEKRKELMQAMTERKTLEKLKEKKLMQYNIEEKKKEQKIIDETVSFKYKVTN